MTIGVTRQIKEFIGVEKLLNSRDTSSRFPTIDSTYVVLLVENAMIKKKTKKIVNVATS